MSANENGQDRESLHLAGGIALMVFGAGLVMSSPAIRKFLTGQLATRLSNPGESMQGLGGLLPDIERYMKLRSM